MQNNKKLVNFIPSQQKKQHKNRDTKQEMYSLVCVCGQKIFGFCILTVPENVFFPMVVLESSKTIPQSQRYTENRN